jgi:hypothetical protein
MRFPKIALAAVGAAAFAVPTFAAIKAMTLSELMGITTDAVHVKILEKTSFRSDFPMKDVVWTKLKVQGESLRTGEAVTTDVVFLGSHDAADDYGTSEMPTLQDTRVGGEAVIFFGKIPDMPGQPNVVYDLSGVYRVERSFGAPVVIGKGEGLAFPENVKLDDASKLVRQTHLELQAAKASSGK